MINTFQAHRRLQAGMTLIELLISITIGLFIIGAALMVFQSTSGAGRQITELTQLRHQGMHAFRVMGKQIREAGALEPQFQGSNANYKFTKDIQWVNASGVPDPAASPVTGTATTLNTSQQQPLSSAYNQYILNCLGQPVTVNRSSNFYVNNGNLMCRTGSSTVDQPIISNVNDFQIRYRIRNGNGKQFVSATGVTDWGEVDAVEICLDLVGDTSTPDAGENYVNCAGTAVPRGQRLHVVQKNLFHIYPG
jgi:type IV pilus assembly protein PilW